MVHEDTEYQFLPTSSNLIWVSSSGDSVPSSNAVYGGSNDQNESLFVGRGWYNGTLLCGKIELGRGGLLIPYKDHEILKIEYEVLVITGTLNPGIPSSIPAIPYSN